MKGKLSKPYSLHLQCTVIYILDSFLSICLSETINDWLNF